MLTFEDGSCVAHWISTDGLTEAQVVRARELCLAMQIAIQALSAERASRFAADSCFRHMTEAIAALCAGFRFSNEKKRTN